MARNNFCPSAALQGTCIAVNENAQVPARQSIAFNMLYTLIKYHQGRNRTEEDFDLERTQDVCEYFRIPTGRFCQSHRKRRGRDLRRD